MTNMMYGRLVGGSLATFIGAWLWVHHISTDTLLSGKVPTGEGLALIGAALTAIYLLLRPTVSK